MFWLVLWATAFITFLLLPICYREESRRLWIDRLCKCTRWDEAAPSSSSRRQRPSPNDEQPAGANGEETEQYHYRLSREQEDDIRECFLVDRLRAYSKSLAEKDIVTIESTSHSDEAVESSANSDETPLQRAPDENLDLEAGVVRKVDADDDEDDDEKTEKKTCDGYDTSTDDGSCDGCMGEFMLDGDGECTHFVSVPLPGELFIEKKKEEEGDDDDDDDKDKEEEEEDVECGLAGDVDDDDDDDDDVACTTNRLVPNGCAICLCPFEAQDRVTWSSNDECKHIFHAECILDWLKASGKRHLRRRRRNEQRTGVVHYANDPLLKITNFPMQCPCCRQVFVAPREEDEDLNKKNETITQPNPAPHAANNNNNDTAAANGEEVPAAATSATTTSEASSQDEPNSSTAAVPSNANLTVITAPPTVDDEEQGVISPAYSALSA